MLEQEIPKHLKKKKSNKSRSKEKADHKHTYELCLIKRVTNVPRPLGSTWTSVSVYNYCTICGKIGDSFYDMSKKETIKMNNGNAYTALYKPLEMLEVYKHLPLFEVNDYLAKYVTLATEN